MDTSDCYDASADARDAARLRQIMDGAVEHAIIEMDLDRRVRGWNAGAERLFGLSAEAALGQSADVIFTAEDRATLVSAREAAQVLRTGRAEGTLYYLRGDGSQFWASSVTTPLRDADGVPDGLLKIVRDQSGMRAAEEALVRALEVARRSDEARSRLMAVAGHDLRQPLQVISMVLDLLRPSLKATDGRSTRLLGLAQEACGQLLADLCALAEASTRSEASANMTAFPIADVLSRISPRWHHHAKAKGLRLRVQSSRALVRSDPVMLTTIIGNLVGNAIKYTGQGSVLVGCRVRGSSVFLDVIDTGIGLAPEVQERIFDAFSQIDTGSDGMGLGLSIVRRTAAVLGHPVQVQSEPGRGSRFTVEMPRVCSGEAAAQG
ncbi:sensor histidine kinase [Methylobacterium sp. J-070]|uniref:sensor histidine kinase n=1 Tax=Methylobacterium sp. J-070 TaxID=2836650 RepID=UPI001FB95519|nr:PAS domain-containing sensor histidine kinase [Methylobacterium sp. J-070]MCJ2049465.1 PAS domain-containing sensor histidine kinase [Methylobacterium sp. J-070]